MEKQLWNQWAINKNDETERQKSWKSIPDPWTFKSRDPQPLKSLLGRPEPQIALKTHFHKKEDVVPFQEQKEEKYIVRTFSESIDDMELVWHRDREDRIVKSLGKTDWMIQMDNELPRPLTEMVYIPKNTYHRVIKGTGDLKVRINKLINLNLKKTQYLKLYKEILN